MLLSLTLLTILFVQIGLSFWVSGAQLAMLLIVLMWGRGLLLAGLNNLWVLLPIPFMFLSLIWARTTSFESEFLRVAREAFLFVFLIAALRWSSRPGFISPPRGVDPMLAGLTAVLAVIAILQTYYYARGSYFGLPRPWFIANNSTLAEELNLYYSNIRPNGTFGEPSYLGFVLFSFMVMVTPVARTSSLAKFVYVLALAIGILSRSLSFLLSAFIVFGIPMFMRASFKTRLQILGAGLVGLGPALAFTPVRDVVTRMVSGGSELGDFSIYTRIVAPLLVLPEFIVNYPFGVPFQSLDLEASFINLGNLDWEAILHNALTNAVFTYGVFGLVLFTIVFRSARNIQLAIYLFASASFNGAFFSFDKIAILVVTAIVYSARLPRHALSGASSPHEAGLSQYAPELRVRGRRGRPEIASGRS